MVRSTIEHFDRFEKYLSSFKKLNFLPKTFVRLKRRKILKVNFDCQTQTTQDGVERGGAAEEEGGGREEGQER
jgi:hypothetical protein